MRINLPSLMSLAGGSDSNFSCNGVEPGGCNSNTSCPGMLSVVDRHGILRNPDLSTQKWLNGFEKAQNNVIGSSKGFESDGSVGLPTPSVMLYDRKIDFSFRLNRAVGCGFVNLGNTCFLSSTLQCLCHLPPWFNYIFSDHHFNNCKMNRSECLVCMFQRLLKNAMHHDSSFAPREIVDKLKQICGHMQRGRQEDAHEFLLCLLNGMQTSLLHGLQRLDPYSQETTVLCQIFGGYLQSRITCRCCRWTSSTYEHFFNISLDIKNAKSLAEALTLFTESEAMDGENAYKCDKCRRSTPADKKYTIYKAPNILILQLKRYSVEEKGHSKLSHHVFFQDTLDLSPFMSTPASRFGQVYQLQCVLVHVGASINSGHYFAYVCGVNNRWFEMNDERVREVPFQDVKSAQAYMLFYVRRFNEPLQKTNSGSGQCSSDKSYSRKNSEFNQSRTKVGITNGVHNGSHLSASGSDVNYKSIVNQGNISENFPNNTASAGKLSANFHRDNHLINGSVYVNKSISAQNGALSNSSVNGFGPENSRESRDSLGIKCSVSSSSSLVSGFTPLLAHNGGSKLSSSIHRDKVVFKIVRPRDRSGGSTVSKSLASATVSKTQPASARAVEIPAPQNSATKLVAYDDESSDQESEVRAEDQKIVINQSAIKEFSGCSESTVLPSLVSENFVSAQNSHAAASDAVSKFEASVPVCTSEKVKDETLSSLNHIEFSHQSLDLETCDVESKWNCDVQPPKIKATSSDSKLHSHILPETRIPQSSLDFCVSSAEQLHDVCVETKLCAKPLYNERNEFVAVDITDSKTCDSVACNMDSTVKLNDSADFNCSNLECIVSTLDTPMQTDSKLVENGLGTSSVNTPAFSPSVNQAGDFHIKLESGKITERKRHKSRDNSASRHKRRKEKHYKDHDSIDSDENSYVWVERTLETIQQEKNVAADRIIEQSEPDVRCFKRHSSEKERNLLMVKQNDHDQEYERKCRLHASLSCSKVDRDSTRCRSRSSGQSGRAKSVERNHRRHKPKSGSSRHNRSSSRDRKQLESSYKKSKDVLKYKNSFLDDYYCGHRHKD